MVFAWTTLHSGGGGDRADDRQADLLGRGVHAEALHVGDLLVERARGRPEVLRTTADAAGAGLDGPARPAVEAHVRAVHGGGRAFAAHLVEAVALAVPLVAPLFDELPGVEVRPPLTLVVDQVPVREQRPAVLVERRHLPEGEEVDEDGDGVRRVVRAAAEVDDLGSRHHVLHALAAGRPVLDEAAVPGARADRERRASVPGHLADEVQCRASADRAEALAGRDGALDHRDVLALVLADRLRAHRLGLLPCPGHDQLVVVPRERLQDELRDVRMGRAQDRLRVAGAVLELTPDEDRALDVHQRIGDLGAVARRERQRGRHHAAELQEGAPADAPLLQAFGQRLIEEHGSRPPHG